MPPIFLFLPEPGKEAATQLEAAAIAALEEDYPNDAARREESRGLQKAFCERMRGNGRFVTSFETLAMLRERALAAIAIWNQGILRTALGRRPKGAVQGIPAVQLGSIGRDGDVLRGH